MKGGFAKRLKYDYLVHECSRMKVKANITKVKRKTDFYFFKFVSTNGIRTKN